LVFGRIHHFFTDEQFVAQEKSDGWPLETVAFQVYVSTERSKFMQKEIRCHAGNRRGKQSSRIQAGVKRSLLALALAGVASVSFSGCIWVHDHHEHDRDWHHDHNYDHEEHHMEHHEEHHDGD
jgi:hypothetical protein